MPQACTPNLLLIKRIMDLHDLGYVCYRDGRFVPTDKGWRLMSAYAEEPMKQPLKRLQ